jgi:hypothetical protein
MLLNYLSSSSTTCAIAITASSLTMCPCIIWHIHPREGSQNVQDALCSSIHAPHTLGDQDNITITDTAATFLGSVFRIGVNNFRTIAILHTSLFSTASDTCGRGAHRPLKFDGKQILQLPLEVPFFLHIWYQTKSAICFQLTMSSHFDLRGIQILSCIFSWLYIPINWYHIWVLFNVIWNSICTANFVMK